eukprot:m.172345 g.172345  ORF g.172345 m.172345 type:complete len:484 (-) comp14578_c1_seq1:148-1599(-)
MGMTESKTIRRTQSAAFLTRPVTDITSYSNTVDTHTHGCAYMQGWRSHMEDAHITLASLPGMDNWAFYAVLDGHAGEAVAKVSERALPGVVLFEVQPVRDSLSAVESGLRRAFIRHDANLNKNFEVLRDRSGATCTSVLISPTHFIFANLGDSRAVLCRGGRVAFSTSDHKPTLARERDRINYAGGRVINGRVDGGLAVSRAFGDFGYKMRSDLAPILQRVSPEPDTTTLERNFVEDDYIILACDGIWDVMTNVAVVKYVNQRLKRNSTDIAAVCEALVFRCLDLGSRDNMSVVIIKFNKDNVPTVGAFNTFETEDVIAERLARSIAFGAIASGVAHIAERTSTSVLPPQHHQQMPSPVRPIIPTPSTTATPQRIMVQYPVSHALMIVVACYMLIAVTATIITISHNPLLASVPMDAIVSTRISNLQQLYTLLCPLVSLLHISRDVCGFVPSYIGSIVSAGNILYQPCIVHCVAGRWVGTARC